MVGAMPRKEGMERKDLLAANVKIFKVQGECLDKFAKKSVKVMVVGNPANTNAIICSHYAPSIPKENFSAMTRLDQNRAAGMYYLVFNMRGKYQTGKIHKWGLEIQKTYLAKNLGNMGRTSDAIGQMREMDTWATSLG